MSAKSKQKTLGFGMKPKPLLLKDVLQLFGNAAAITGNKSQVVKVQEIKEILVRASGLESKFIIRGLQGKLSIRPARKSVIAALAQHASVLFSVPLLYGVRPTEKLVEGRNYSDDEKVRFGEAKGWIEGSIEATRSALYNQSSNTTHSAAPSSLFLAVPHGPQNPSRRAFGGRRQHRVQFRLQ